MLLKVIAITTFSGNSWLQLCLNLQLIFTSRLFVISLMVFHLATLSALMSQSGWRRQRTCGMVKQRHVSFCTTVNVITSLM